MVYTARRVTSRYRRRTYRKSARFGTRGTFRRSTVRKRTYRRRPRRTMSRKRILNISSRKKRDTMAPISGEQSTAVSPTPGPRQFLASDGVVICLYRPTERQRITEVGGNPARVDDPAARTATEVYYRGIKERISIATSGSSMWKWRRICFTFKSDRFNFNPNDPADVGNFTLMNVFTSNGYMRAINAFNNADSFQAAMLQQISAYVFQGTEGIDWNSYYTSKVDTERVNLKYDKTMHIKSGNDAGVMRDYKFWHPMNHTFIYDEDERAGTQQQGTLSSMLKRSMGDYYIMDIMTCNDLNSETLLFNPNATIYWHER